MEIKICLYPYLQFLLQSIQIGLPILMQNVSVAVYPLLGVLLDSLS